MKADKTMQGKFIIIKGNYVKGAQPSVTNEVSGSINYLGGYNPEVVTTTEWYMCMDRLTYTPISCSHSLGTVLDTYKKYLVRYKNDFPLYLKRVFGVRNYKKITYTNKYGKVAFSAPSMRKLYECVDIEYGHYFEDIVREAEESALETLKGNSLINKSRKKKHIKLTLKEDNPARTDFTLKKKAEKIKIKKLKI